MSNFTLDREQLLDILPKPVEGGRFL